MSNLARRPWVLAGGVIALIIIVWVSWYLASPLFIENRVDEAFPFEMPNPDALAQMSSEEMEKLQDDFVEALPSEDELAPLSDEERVEVADKAMTAAEMMPDKEMEESMPKGEDPVAILTGQFVDADNFHKGAGLATIYRLPDGSHVLRFEDFEVTNGPDLHVFLGSHPSPSNRSEVMEGYVDLGSLKGNVGSQNYELPAGTDPSQFQSIVIYCVPFHVIFSTATLGSS